MQIADRPATPDPPEAAVTSPEAMTLAADTFEAFVRDAEPRLRRALVAAYGPEQGRDAAAEALAYAWEHWDGCGTWPTRLAICSGSARPADAG